MPEVCDASISNKDEGRSVFTNLVHRIRELPKVGRRRRVSWHMDGDGDGRTVRGQKQHRRACLQCLPPELLHMIFVEACTDGGRTGCALSLVSKDIRARSRAARFHSVSLLSPSLWKLLRFLHEYGKRRDTAIQGKPPHSMPRVRHLCLLVDIPSVLYGDRYGVKSAKQDFVHCDGSLHQRLRDHILHNLSRGLGESRDLPQELGLQILRLELAYCRAVLMLLEQVAGDLYSLCLYQFPNIRGKGRDDLLPPPCATAFPNLRELWLGGRDGREKSLFHRDTRFPALRRLHVRADFAPDITHWLSVAPRLDCLQIFASPGLLSDLDVEGQQRLRAVAAHPLWGEKGKQLTIQVAVPLGKRDDPFAWAHFGQRATAVRQELADAARPLVFVPCYAAQDVDGHVCKAVEDAVGRRRFWPSGSAVRTKPVTQDELFRRDWLARTGGWREGIYVEDFWGHFVEEGEGERKHIEKTIGRYAWPSDEPTYVAPLVIRADAV